MKPTSYHLELTDKEYCVLQYALGCATGVFYDGTRRHGPEEDELFRKIMNLRNKITEQADRQET